MSDKIGRNDPCTCGSGKKYKKCCIDKDRDEKRFSASSIKSVGVSRSLVSGSSEPEKFDSLEAVYASLRSEGYDPVLNNEFDMRDDLIDEDDDNPVIKAYEIDLYCKHGHTYESRTYWEYADGVFECIESGFGFDLCPICDSR